MQIFLHVINSLSLIKNSLNWTLRMQDIFKDISELMFIKRPKWEWKFSVASSTIWTTKDEEDDSDEARLLTLPSLPPSPSRLSQAAPWLCSTSFSLHCRRLEASVVEAPMLLSNVVCTTRTWSTTKPSPGCNISPIAPPLALLAPHDDYGQLLGRDPP